MAHFKCSERSTPESCKETIVCPADKALVWTHESALYELSKNVIKAYWGINCMKKGGKINTMLEVMSVWDSLMKSFSFLAKINQIIEILSRDISLIYGRTLYLGLQVVQ